MSEHAELIERLKNRASEAAGSGNQFFKDHFLEAADALSSSQAEIERLRAALKVYAEPDDDPYGAFARSALSGQPGESA